MRVDKQILGFDVVAGDMRIGDTLGGDRREKGAPPRARRERSPGWGVATIYWGAGAGAPVAGSASLFFLLPA
ncbi:MAG: hypothetical protein ACRER2_14470, partial [Methylococcales bacterium]